MEILSFIPTLTETILFTLIVDIFNSPKRVDAPVWLRNKKYIHGSNDTDDGFFLIKKMNLENKEIMKEKV